MKPEFTKKPEFMRLANEQKRNAPPLFLELLIFFIVFFAGSFAQIFLSVIPIGIWASRTDAIPALLSLPDLETAIIQLLNQIPTWLLLIVNMTGVTLGIAAVLYCRLFERRKLATMGFVRSCALLHLLGGAAAAVLVFAGIALLCLAFGGIQIGESLFLPISLPRLGFYFASVALPAIGSSILFYGYLATSLSKRLSLAASVLITSLVYAAFFQRAGEGSVIVPFVNLFLFAAVSGLIVLLTEDIWGVIGFQILWAFCQTNLFYVSEEGIDADTCVLSLKYSSDNPLLNGGGYGIDLSLSATLILLGTLGILILLLRKKAPAALEVAEEADDSSQGISQ